MKTILLNAMFVGRYGEKNIDGEIINFYLDDNGIQNYFIPEHGDLPTEILKDEIEAILMVYKIDGHTFEIIGKYVPKQAKYVARGVERSETIDEKDDEISYGKVLLKKIHNDNSPVNKNFSYVSFRGGEVYFLKPSKRIVLSGKDTSKSDFQDCDVHILKTYENEIWGSKNFRIFSMEDETCFKNKDHLFDANETYKVLKKIIDEDCWYKNTTKVIPEIATIDQMRNIDYLGLNHIIKGSHIELLSSNWLAHYISMSPENFMDFFSLNNHGRLLDVVRESESNIDILIKFERAIVVLENKIKAEIGMNQKGFSCQLEKYYNYIAEKKEYANLEKKYIILCPNYHKIKIKKQIDKIIAEYPSSAKAMRSFDIKTYSQLKENILKHTNISYAKYYTDLLDFIDDHSHVCEHYQLEKLSKKRFVHRISINI